MLKAFLIDEEMRANAEHGSVPAHHANQDLQNFMYAKKHTDPDLFRWSSRPGESVVHEATSADDVTVNVSPNEGDSSMKQISLRSNRMDEDNDL